MNEYSGQDVGTQRRSHQTEPKSNVLTGRSKFPMSHIFPTTMRYGEISPFYYQHGIGDDTIPLYSEHALRTHTLSSPVESDVEMQKTYFAVPMDAIYPLQWERMQVSPSHGDDVPDDTRLCVSFIEPIISIHSKFIDLLNSTDSLNSSKFTRLLYHIVFLESVFSNGSLFAQFNMHFSPLVSFINEDGSSRSVDFDTWLDKFYPSLFSKLADDFNCIFTIDGKKYACTGEIVGDSYTNNGVRYVNIHQLLDLLRHESFDIDLDGDTIPTEFFTNGDDFEDLRTLSIQHFSQKVNLEVLIAYQLGCLQYFSDSRIDDIFDAPRFRSLVNSIYYDIYSVGGSIYPFTFSYNGEKLNYDIFSGHNFSTLLEIYSNDSSTAISSNILKFYDLCKLLFSFRNSLRFGDYFLTARLRQYGVGDTSIDTSSGSVSALDITKNIQWQRFLQSVSWSKPNVKDYIRDVLGITKKQTPRKDVPMFIAKDRFRIDGYEVENTGSEQRDVNSITTLVKTKQGKFAFEFEPENQCIVIGVIHFDVERIYSRGLDRMHTHQNRFDDIIPEMQFIGDQEIRKNEFDVTLGDGVFGWTLRYMPYKIRTNYAAGAFVNHLKSWLMITDNKDGNITTGSIDSMYLRSTPPEFDRFYTSLTGCSLATYYHFMVINRNYQELTRDLVYAPEPLK